MEGVMDTTYRQPALAAGDALIEQSYEEHHAALFGHLLSLTRDPATAEDIAQEAFLRLTREVHEGRAPDNIGGWLHRVGDNLVVSRARHAKVVDHFAPALVERGVESSPEDEVVRRERDRLIHAALGELSATDRAAVLLAAQGYGGPEIARLLARTQAATRTLLSRARGKLRVRLVLADVA
jgi:RNA polymerase sigma-70 factor (ECF subfamily)